MLLANACFELNIHYLDLIACDIKVIPVEIGISSYFFMSYNWY